MEKGLGTKIIQDILKVEQSKSAVHWKDLMELYYDVLYLYTAGGLSSGKKKLMLAMMFPMIRLFHDPKYIDALGERKVKVPPTFLGWYCTCIFKDICYYKLKLQTIDDICEYIDELPLSRECAQTYQYRIGLKRYVHMGVMGVEYDVRYLNGDFYEKYENEYRTYNLAKISGKGFDLLKRTREVIEYGIVDFAVDSKKKEILIQYPSNVAHGIYKTQTGQLSKQMKPYPEMERTTLPYGDSMVIDLYTGRHVFFPNAFFISNKNMEPYSPAVPGCSFPLGDPRICKEWLWENMTSIQGYVTYNNGMGNPNYYRNSRRCPSQYSDTLLRRTFQAMMRNIIQTEMRKPPETFTKQKIKEKMQFLEEAHLLWGKRKKYVDEILDLLSEWGYGEDEDLTDALYRLWSIQRYMCEDYWFGFPSPSLKDKLQMCAMQDLFEGHPENIRPKLEGDIVQYIKPYIYWTEEREKEEVEKFLENRKNEEKYRKKIGYFDVIGGELQTYKLPVEEGVPKGKYLLPLTAPKKYQKYRGIVIYDREKNEYRGLWHEEDEKIFKRVKSEFAYDNLSFIVGESQGES